MKYSLILLTLPVVLSQSCFDLCINHSNLHAATCAIQCIQHYSTSTSYPTPVPINYSNPLDPTNWRTMPSTSTGSQLTRTSPPPSMTSIPH
ncbi:hypothetical protein DSO57_1008836 [Entomophthora muscae]|uniref:Uncharacterized protein n=1 Tax=Entomophthora muscae TaxID=34485 RepID=A0ACC2RLQ7_9FUNG|nr:hypothetical protein DSO57_1008836 [Entomophthora muscae]